MTFIKITGSFVSLIVSLYCFWYNKITLQPMALGMIYATVYFSLSLIDILTETLILYKLYAFLKLNETSVISKIQHTEAIKWILVLQSLFFLFITTTGILEFNFLVRIYGIDFTKFLLLFSLSYSIVSISHVISFIIFTKRHKKQTSQYSGFFKLNSTLM